MNSEFLLPLDGVRVIDFTSALAGPYATQTLGDFGADVVKVEQPSGDMTRAWGPFFGDLSSYFTSINRNKQSISLDLKNEADRAIARDLIATADVVVENYRPGVADRLGIGYEAAKALRHGIVYCSISGYGADQPPLPGYDQVVQATSGWTSLTGWPEQAPVRTGAPVGDVAAGMNAALTIAAALLRKERTGSGAHIDIAMQDTLVSMLAYQAGRYLASNAVPQRVGNNHPTIAPYGGFPTADGNAVIAVGNNAQFARLCKALGLPQLLENPDFAENNDRISHRPELDSAIAAKTRALTTKELIRVVREAGVPVAEVRNLEQVFEDPASHARGLVLEYDDPQAGRVRVPGGGWHIDGQRAEIRLPPPRLDADRSEIREWLARQADRRPALRGRASLNE